MLDESAISTNIPADAPEPGSSTSRRGSLHGAAVAELRDMIVSGRLPPGTALREKELCAELGISRTPLREAIRTLAREGLVKLWPNRSAVVAPLDVSAVENLYQVIGHVESLGARLACRRATPDDISGFSVRHHEMLIHYHRGDLQSYIRHNAVVHRALLELSRNEVLLEVWEPLHARVEQARTLANLYPDRWHAAVGEHEAMLKALTARDEDTLAGLMEAHYANGLDRLVAVQTGRQFDGAADKANPGQPPRHEAGEVGLPIL